MDVLIIANWANLYEGARNEKKGDKADFPATKSFLRVKFWKTQIFYLKKSMFELN